MMTDIPVTMPAIVVICAACGVRAESWIQRPDGTICVDCNAKRAARAVLADEIAAADAAGRELARALEWLFATSEQYYLVSGYVPALGYRRDEYDDAGSGLEQASKQAAAALANPVVQTWLAEPGEE